MAVLMAFKILASR